MSAPTVTLPLPTAQLIVATFLPEKIARAKVPQEAKDAANHLRAAVIQAEITDIVGRK